MGRPLVATAESLAAWPGPAMAPSIADNATTARKRRNPINPSPARTRQPDCFELPLVFERLKSPNPCAGAKIADGLVPWFLSWPGLLLERTERKKRRIFPGKTGVKYRGTQGNAGDRTARWQCRAPGLMRSEHQAFVKPSLMRAGNVG